MIKYRDYKNFEPVKFLADVRRTNFDALEDPDDFYDNLTNSFRAVVEKHAPLKTKLARGNSTPFMTRELKKAIYTRTRLKNRLNKYPTNQNEKNYKKKRNKYAFPYERRQSNNILKKQLRAVQFLIKTFGNWLNLFFLIKVVWLVMIFPWSITIKL